MCCGKEPSYKAQALLRCSDGCDQQESLTEQVVKPTIMGFQAIFSKNQEIIVQFLGICSIHSDKFAVEAGRCLVLSKLHRIGHHTRR